MINVDTAWFERNDAYLADAVAWIRARLTAMLPTAAASQSVLADRHACNSRLAGLFRQLLPKARVAAQPYRPAPAPPAANITEIEARLAAATAVDPPPALSILCQRLGLSIFEKNVLMLCIAFELDTGIAASCAAIQGGPAHDYPTFAMAMAMFDAPTWQAHLASGPLRYWRLIEASPQGTQAMATGAIHVDERIFDFVKGLNQIDDRLMHIVRPFSVPGTTILPPSHIEISELLVQRAAGQHDTRIGLYGADRDSQYAIATAVAEACGRRIFRLPGELLLAADNIEMLARLWHRETLMTPVALFIDANDRALESMRDGVLARFVTNSGGLLFIGSREPPLLDDRATTDVEISRPRPAEQAQLWRAHVAHLDDATCVADRLASQFDLSQAAITAISSEANIGIDVATLPERLWDGCRQHTRPAMARLADKIDAKAGWGDIVLPVNETEQLHAIVAQMQARATVYDTWNFRARMNRGLGISVLFAGDSGTGKTMAAEVLANALRLDLYRIDLSAVVSKYIGETTKNLRTVFDAAEAGGAILFFDEADALFGKRSEVKDSHDRYANIEIDYLLQRIEEFSGLAILATNMKSAIDPAFARRMRFIVTYSYPGFAERRAMWERAFPPQVPADGLDFDRLARLNLSGGNVRSVALNAAFIAAQSGGRITTAMLLDAARAELRKLGQPVNESDFRAVATVRKVP